MKTKLIFACLTVICATGLSVTSDAFGQGSRDDVLKETESRMRGIYEEGAFRARGVNARWLDDSSGYTVMENKPGGNRAVRVRYDAATGKRSVMESDGASSNASGNLSPDGERVLYSENGNLLVRDVNDGESIALTTNLEGSEISNYRGMWSPDGKRIAFIQSDRSKVRMRARLIPTDPSYPEVAESKFARVGEVITSLKVGVVDAEGVAILWLPIPEPTEGFYLGEVSWAGNSDEVLVEKLSRFRDEREFLLADVRTGAVTRIYHETDSAWVVASIAKNSGLQWIDGGRAFVVINEQDGWRHAYVYSRDGKEKRLITPGAFDIIERVKIDEGRGLYYFNASPENGTQKYLYRARLDGDGKPERVTPTGGPGTHHYDFSPDGTWAFHRYSTFDRPPVTELVEFPGHRVVRVLEDNQKLRKKMKAMIKQPTEFLKLDIGGGVVMDAWMIKPADFNASRKYPVFVYVYGEPHAQTVLNDWGRVQNDYHRVIADLGYLVVSIDNRGTPAPKGAAWRRAVFGSLGPLSTEEQAAGIKELGRMKSYVDLDRVGIWGWSGGGSNTLNAMFRKPGVYDVGIAVAAKPQPHLYNAWFQEIYMNTREVNAEGYRKAAAINYAEGLEGDLLIVHGTGEMNTHVQIIERLVDRLIELGKPFDYMSYPHRDHGIRKGAGTSVHLRMHMVRYLLDHLEAGAK